MITPRWVNTAAQPIAIEDVIEYLVAAARLPRSGNLTFEIGGADVTSYVGIMREYARQRKLRRWIVRVPFLSLSLSSRWLTLITPVYAAIGRCLIESVRNPSVVRNPAALEAFDIRPMGITRAIERALTNEDQDVAETRWSDARAPGGCRERHNRNLLTIFWSMNRPSECRCARSGVRADSPDWRPDRLVLRQRAVEDSRSDRSDDGRRRDAARPARSRDSVPGKHLGFLARGVLRARPAASIVCRDEGSGTRLAGVPRRTRWLFDRDHGRLAQFEPRGLSGMLYWYLLSPDSRS